MLRTTALLLAVFSTVPTFAEEISTRPHILVLTVDTLRADHVSSLGYARPTTPEIDRLMESGARFTSARAVQPLTCPSMSSMWTSLYPQDHGATRNAIRVRRRLGSLSKSLRRQGYHTAAFVSNFVLKDKLSGLGEHFEHFEGVFTRKQWLIIRDEARAEDVTAAALEHLEEQLAEAPAQPVLLWVHYIDPHRPYVFHEGYAQRLGIGRSPTKIDRYDTEIAHVDGEVGRLLSGIRKFLPPDETLIVFASDHGEGLGQHQEAEHGNHVFETTLHVPLSFTWPGHIPPRTFDAPASLLDVGPTILGLLGAAIPESFQGFDWAPVFRELEPVPDHRLTYHQAHKIAALSRPTEAGEKPRHGLIAVALVEKARKEVFYVRKGDRLVFDLVQDPEESRRLPVEDDDPSEALLLWMGEVYDALDTLDTLPLDSLDAESIAKLRALGYVE